MLRIIYWMKSNVLNYAMFHRQDISGKFCGAVDGLPAPPLEPPQSSYGARGKLRRHEDTGGYSCFILSGHSWISCL